MGKLAIRPSPMVRAVASKVGVRVGKYSPEILLGVGIVGGVTATVLACKATLHLEEVLDHHQEVMDKISEVSENKEEYPEYTDDKVSRDRYVQTIKTAVSIGKLYLPSIIVGGLSIGMIVGGHYILHRRNVILTSMYMATKTAYEEYRKRIAKEIGEDKELEIYREIREKAETDEKSEAVREGPLSKLGYSPYARIFDEGSRWYKRNADLNKAFLMAQQTYANNLLKIQGHIFLNEVYDMLDIPRTSMGAVVGWVYGNGDSYVDFGIFDPSKSGSRDFVNCREASIWLDFNVDGVIYDLI